MCVRAVALSSAGDRGQGDLLEPTLHVAPVPLAKSPAIQGRASQILVGCNRSDLLQSYF